MAAKKFLSIGECALLCGMPQTRTSTPKKPRKGKGSVRRGSTKSRRGSTKGRRGSTKGRRGSQKK